MGKYKHTVLATGFPTKLPSQEIITLVVGRKLPQMVGNIDRSNILLNFDDIPAAIIKMAGWQELELLSPCRAWVLDHSRNVIQRVVITNMLAVSLETATNEIRWGTVKIDGQAENIQRVVPDKSLFPTGLLFRSFEILENWILIGNLYKQGLLGVNFLQNQWFALKLLPETHDRCTSVNLSKDMLFLGCSGRLYVISVDALLDILDKLPDRCDKHHSMSIPQSQGLGKYLEFRELVGPSVVWEPAIRQEYRNKEKTKDTPLPWGSIIDAFPVDDNATSIIIKTTYWVAMSFPNENLLVPIVSAGLSPFVFPVFNKQKWIEIHTQNIYSGSLVKDKVTTTI